MIAPTAQLGIGLYTPEQAAFYARVHTRLLKRWLFGDAQGGRVVEPQIREQDAADRVVTFFDLIQALAIRAIRSEYRIPLQKIRDAVEYARRFHGVEYPFAMRHSTYLFSDQRRKGHGEILIKIPGVTDDDDRFIQVSGKQSGNLVIREVVEVYLDELNFDALGLAEQWQPMKSDSDAILLDPHRRFGEPIVQSCGHTAETLWEASISEGGIANAAEAFGVSQESVKLACKYFDHLKSTAA